MISCGIKQSSGVDCPTCGFQRSVKLLFEGEFLDSLYMYPATIPLLGIFIFTILHLIFKFEQGAKIIIIGFCSTVGIILINYAVKLIDGRAFECCG